MTETQPPARAPERDVVRERIDDWRRRLIDLTYRNRLIRYRPTRATTLEIESPSLATLLADPYRTLPWRFFFPPEPASEEHSEEHAEEDDAAALVDELVVRAAQAAHRPPQEDEIVVRGELNPRRINRILENLARKSNGEYQDKALRILYIAAGFLDWVDPAREEALSSPLILVPVELRRMSAREPYQLFFVDDEEITINPSLTEKLRRDVGRDIPADWAWEDKPVETELAEIEEAIEGTGWSVRHDAAIGLFSFQKFVMYRDLLTNEEAIGAHPVVQSLARKQLDADLARIETDIPRLVQLDEVQPPATDLSILDADATQRRCIEAAQRGQSFVMHGPPGTGKSQTIANVIANAIGNGKRVLFVSEKAAALDVVHSRLASQGLDDFCLLLHGAHGARREVVEALHRSLTSEIVPQRGMSSHELERLDQLRELLNSTAEVIHLPLSELGDRSLRDVLGQLAQLHAAPSVPSAPEAIASREADVRGEFQQLDEIFQRLGQWWRVSPRAFVWRGYAGARFTADDRARVLSGVRTLAKATEALARVQEAVAHDIGVTAPVSFAAGDRLAGLVDHLEHAPELYRDWLRPTAHVRVRRAIEEARGAYERLAMAMEAFAAVYGKRPLVDFDPALGTRLERALENLESLIGRTSEWETRLLPVVVEEASFLDSAGGVGRDLVEAATDCALLLGQPVEGFTVTRMRELARLGALAFAAEDRPERDWLSTAGRERAEAALAETKPSFSRHQAERARLLGAYTEAAFGLDAAELYRRFSDDYTSFFSKLGGAYRRDAKLVKSVRRDGKLPESVAEDLGDLSALQLLEVEIESHSERLQRALGIYFTGPSTDVEKVERALTSARTVTSLASPRSDLDKLAAQVAVGASPDSRLAQLADRITTGLDAFEAGLRSLRPLVKGAAELFDRAPVETVAESLERIRSAFAEIARLADELAHGASHEAQLSGVFDRVGVLDEAHAATDAVLGSEAGWREVLEQLYQGAETNWSAGISAAEWLARLEELLEEPAPEVIVSGLTGDAASWPDFGRLRDARSTFDAAVDEVAALFEPEARLTFGSSLREWLLDWVAKTTQALEVHVDDLHDWTEFRAARDRARARDWGPFLDALVDHEVVPEDVVPAFRRAYWNRRLEALFDADPDLADRGATYLRWIDEFKSLDRRLVRTGPDRVIAAVNRGRTSYLALAGSQVALLKNEAAKKRRHMPVRVLLTEISELLSELKPCLMMSPLAVSHFLSPEHVFDLVVFDEASQVPPQDAINCIYRGQQLIVAGDNRQLPPTPFFQIAEAEETWDDDAADATEDMESILDACDALLPQHPLRWHYRSRHEDLIAFSNHHVYDDSLVTFPSADAFSPSKGVRFVYVPHGEYERGKGINRPEARAVAERVFEHLRAGRSSVGVITFNVAQETAVSDELERLRIEHPEFEDRFSGDRLDGVFVKNLESVQGDERDVIIFSVGYGRSADGKFSMNFGPLNKDGGYRRLNVAVTRARELVEVVSSVRAADFSLTEGGRRGPRLLQEYIRYAETEGASGKAEDDELARRIGDTGTLEEAIADVVEELGFEPILAVGASVFRVDIAVREDPTSESYLLAIETDGESYRSIPTARDRERLREEILKNLNWRVHRVWSLDWVRNRPREVERLRVALTAPAPAGEDTHEEPAVVRERTERRVADLLDALDSGEVPWVKTFERAPLSQPRTDYEFHESVNRDTQRSLVVALLAVEAPVHVDYVIKRLAEMWDLRRTGERVRAAGQQAVKMAVRSGAAEMRGPFVWRPGQQLDIVREPDWNDKRTLRPMEHIPPEEIRLTIAKLRETSGGTLYDNLITDVARVLGYDRAGPRIRAAIEKQLDESDA